MNLTRRSLLASSALAVAASALPFVPALAQSGDTIKVGILHSLSGLMEI